MRNNGIEGDEVTLGVLNILKRKRDRAFRVGGRVEEEVGRGEGSSGGGVKDGGRREIGDGDDIEKKRERARWMWWRMTSNVEAWVGIRERRRVLREELNERRSEMVEGEDYHDDEGAEFDEDVEARVRDTTGPIDQGTGRNKVRRKAVSEQPVVML